jgi:hypothetical protein
MPGVIENGSIAFISNGFYAGSFDMSPTAFVIHSRATNRLMVHSDSAMVWASSTGHYEIESGRSPAFESTITGYRIGTAISTTVVFITDPTVTSACPLAVRLPANPTVDGFQVRSSANTPLLRIDGAGRIVTRGSAGPVLDDLQDGEVSLWVEPTTGNVKVTRRVADQLTTLTVQSEPS